MHDVGPETADLSQAEQAALLSTRGAAPTTPDEEQLLAEKFGEPDANGVYGAPQDGGDAA